MEVLKRVIEELWNFLVSVWAGRDWNIIPEKPKNDKKGGRMWKKNGLGQVTL